jgi:hypothetical protein
MEAYLIKYYDDDFDLVDNINQYPRFVMARLLVTSKKINIPTVKFFSNKVWERAVKVEPKDFPLYLNGQCSSEFTDILKNGG